MPRRSSPNPLACAACVLGLAVAPLRAEQRYFGRAAAEDRNGVIAPWYEGLNGQCDFRVQVAAETLKRYPWALSPKTGLPAPDYMYNGRWAIAPEGTITPGKLENWGNGDLVQRNAYAMLGMIDYYRYSGDPAAIAHVAMMAEVVLSHCRTPDDHPWPRFPVSVPLKGEPYGQCDPRGLIQLDLAALYGIALTRAHQLTGNAEWLKAASHWGDMLAAKCDHRPGVPPWNRYANPEEVFWDDLQTGGVILLLQFIDELVRVGHTGPDGSLLRAREAGLAYVRDVLSARWWEDDVWARDYWDWTSTAQSESISEFFARYMMANPDLFPLWRTDVRNVITLFMHRACVSPRSNGGLFSGAWAYPEGSQCCGRSLSYPPMQMGAALAEYAVRTGDAWARELARRQLILATYDARETGVVDDSIDGGQVVAGGWFQISHPLPLKYVLDAIGWLPEELGPNRENHIVRSSSIVTAVEYGDGRVRYTTFDAPEGTETVLRLAFRPSRIEAEGTRLSPGEDSKENGFAVRELSNGDCIVTIRHAGSREVLITGDDPQEVATPAKLEFTGRWEDERDSGDLRLASTRGASVSYAFTGNQVRVLGSVGPDGGLAEVYIDDVREAVGIDAWNPGVRHDQVLYARSGLEPGRHTIRIVAGGRGNPRSTGGVIRVSGIAFSAASGRAAAEHTGPTGPQRWILGYAQREDYRDTHGNLWRPGTELVVRLGHLEDAVARTWYARPRRQTVEGTRDPVLYSHGMHAPEFTAYATVAPGTYHVRVRLMEHRTDEPARRALNIAINGRAVAGNVDIAATAMGRPSSVEFVSPNGTKIWDGLNRAVDLVFNDVRPQNGVIAVTFRGTHGGEAIVSAIEFLPGSGEAGTRPVAAPPATGPAESQPPAHP